MSTRLETDAAGLYSGRAVGVMKGFNMDLESERAVGGRNSPKAAFLSRTQSASQACAEYLRDQIVSGSLENGSAIVIDRVAATLGTSHTPVREAIRRLEAEGLVSYTPNRGARVRGLYEAEFEELVDLRKAVEPIVLAKAIRLAEKGAFDEADREFRHWRKGVGAKEMLSRQWKFLRAMYQPSGLVRSLEVVDANWRLIERYHQFAWQTSELVRAQDQRLKEEILVRCRARQEHEALAALTDAIDWGASIVREQLG